MAEMPRLVEAQTRFADTDFSVLGITDADLLDSSASDFFRFMYGCKDNRNHVAVVSTRRITSRDPARSILSMYKHWPDFHVDETGFAEQRALFDHLTEMHGTPPPVIEERIARHWLLSAKRVAWRNDDLAAIAERVRAQPDPHVDLAAVFGHPPDPRLLMEDGLHPSLAGQVAIVRAVVARLAAL